MLAHPRALLIPKLRSHFAEFLNHRSPERLRLLASPTCVSFSTVKLLQPQRLFLVVELMTSSTRDSSPGEFMSWGICLPLDLSRPTGCSTSPITFRTTSPHQSMIRRRNINLLSIVYAFRPRLRDRLTLGGFPFPRKP